MKAHFLLIAAAGLTSPHPLSQVSSKAGPNTSSIAQQLTTLLTANGLKADVSFLASDLLEGRGTPSRGLDLAAEYIASQYRRAGARPGGGGAGGRRRLLPNRRIRERRAGHGRAGVFYRHKRQHNPGEPSVHRFS